MFDTWLKLPVLKLADYLTLHNDPFEEFTRPARPKSPEPLAVKAQGFQKDLVENFRVYNGHLWTYRRPAKGPALWDVGDQAIWHGVFQSAFAFQFAVTQDPAVAVLLAAGVLGLQLHQTIHGEKSPRLVRGIYENGTWQDDASNDSATGHMAGIYFTWLHGPAELKPLCAQLMANLANELITHDYALVGPEGQPTTFGRLVSGAFTDPLRLTLCLAILRAAHRMTGDAQYYVHFRILFSQYRGLIPYAKVKALWWEKNYDTHRAALHLSILADLDPGASELCRQGLERIWAFEHKTGNAWIAYLCGRHIRLSDEHVAQTKKLLSEFAVEDRGPDTERKNSDRTDFRRVLWDGKYMAAQPLPPWQVGNNDFAWRCNLRTIDQYVGNHEASTLYSGGDFLCAYWLGRLTQRIAPFE